MISGAAGVRLCPLLVLDLLKCALEVEPEVSLSLDIVRHNLSLLDSLELFRDPIAIISFHMSVDLFNSFQGVNLWRSASDVFCSQVSVVVLLHDRLD